METELQFKFNNDPWLDNGLEYFYKLIKEDSEGISNIKINNSGLNILISDYDKFLQHLIHTIKNIRINVVIWDEDKKTGAKKEIKKDHILIQEGKKEGVNKKSRI